MLVVKKSAIIYICIWSEKWKIVLDEYLMQLRHALQLKWKKKDGFVEEIKELKLKHAFEVKKTWKFDKKISN